MEKTLQQTFISRNISTHRNQGILIVPVPDQTIGIQIVKEILYTLVDQKTALFLSGGKTPKEILRLFVEEERLNPGVVGQVDERFGKSLHENSNERLFTDCGFLDYLHVNGINFHSMLDTKGISEKGREDLAEDYDQLLRGLFTIFQKSVATLGIGVDGHIAGIAPNRHDFTNPLFSEKSQQKMVSSFIDKTGSFGQRITMTFLGLSMMDVLMPIVFGEDKKEALEKLFEDGKEEEIPARFLKRPEIAAKTLIITDQPI